MKWETESEKKFRGNTLRTSKWWEEGYFRALSHPVMSAFLCYPHTYLPLIFKIK